MTKNRGYHIPPTFDIMKFHFAPLLVASGASAFTTFSSLSFTSVSRGLNTGLRMSDEAASPSLSFNPDETAVVLIEYQNDFTSPGGKLYDAVQPCMESTNMLENSQKLVAAAREAGCKIIHLPIVFEEGHNEIGKNPYGVLAGVKEGKAFQAGEWGSQICESMTPLSDDIVVKGKTALCGFHSTNLDFIMRQNEIKNVVLGGFLTNCCVESTMRQAYELGYRVYTLKDCSAATSIEAQDSAFEHNFGMFSVPTTSADVLAGLAK